LQKLVTARGNPRDKGKMLTVAGDRVTMTIPVAETTALSGDEYFRFSPTDEGFDTFLQNFL
jgi:hypothetical protein